MPSLKNIPPHYCRHAKCLCVALAVLLSPASAQTTATARGGSILERRYEAAQRYQAAHDLSHAAQQYRIFIADSLGEVARGRANAGEYEKAADDFDEALRLVPDFPALQLEYAQTALRNGNLEHARVLAAGILRTAGSNPKLKAGAYEVLGRVLLKSNKDAEAKAQLEAAVALDPSFENGYELAVADLDRGDRVGATQIFKEMLASFGDTAAIHMYFGQAYGTSDFQSEAVTEFKEAIAQDSRLPGVHYSLAAAYLSTAGDSKLPEAEAELREEIAVSPHNAAAYAALGHLLAEQHTNTAEAESDLKRATELDPKDPDAFLYLGQFYADAKRPAEAEAALRESITLTTDPSRNGYQVQRAHYLLGRLLMQAGQPEEGKREITAAQSLMQQNLSDARSRLSEYLHEDKPAKAASIGPTMPMDVEQKAFAPEVAHQVDAFEKQIGPAVADSYNNLGAIAGSEGDYHTALLYFERTAEWNPAMPGLDYNLGRAAFEAGDFRQAIGALSRFLQQHPRSDEVRAWLGVSQFMTRDYAGAKGTLQPLDGKPSASLRVQYAYAASLVQTGDLSEGVARFRSLEKANPELAEIHRSLGEAYAAQKAPDAATELELAIRLNPQDAEAHAALGQFLMARGNAKQAVLHLRSALDLDPGNVTFRQELAAADALLH